MCKTRSYHIVSKEIEKNSNFYNLKNERKSYLNYNEEDEMEIQGFAFDKTKTRVVWTFYIITFGLLRLFFHWYPVLQLKATHTKCSLKLAEKVLITDIYKNKFKSHFVKEVKTLRANSQSGGESTLEFNLCDGTRKDLIEARVIKCKKLMYIWDDKKGAFYKLAGFDKGITRADLHTFKGQTKEEQNLKRAVYGNNEIDVPVQTILTLLVLEALTPFYIFQMFSLSVWILENYIYYTIAIVIMSTVGITTSIIQTRRNQKNLKGTVLSQENVTVCRENGVFEEIPSSELVPGDVITIPSTGCQVLCDAVLISGNCVVNESMLTGESVPVTKTVLPNNQVPFSLKDDVSHTLFCGTIVIQTRSKGKVLAVVIRTGYLTAKGELVRSILYPPPADFKFDTDSYKFIGVLAVIAVIGVIYTIVSKSYRSVHVSDILLKALDVVTIAVPPALPAAMTVGKLYALNRLKNSKIFCINSRVINVTGSVDCVCFDKTGTLTENELDMWGIVPVENRKFQEPVKDAAILSAESPLLLGMATCHSLALLDDHLAGDPLDIKMFASTKWTIMNDDMKHNILVKPLQSTERDAEAVIIKQFQFSSNLQRMSVIARINNRKTLTVFCKGSPEIIYSLSMPLTVPNDFLETLEVYTSQGYRVLALATKVLEGVNVDDIEELNREEVEDNLEFIGLLILENRLKPQTTPMIDVLKEANLKIVMITGDNIKTGIHVARECGIVEPDETIIEIVADSPTKTKSASIQFVVSRQPKTMDNNNGMIRNIDVEKELAKKYCFATTGKSWANIVEYFPNLVQKIVVKGKVFTRMSGIQKQQLVEQLKDLKYYVAMSGDGANDCGALKAAHVGISLSEAEASVASPFTSQEQNISCIPKVIKEGRAALVTSFGVFKVMLCYSLTQFASVLILYNIDANLSSLQFLFIDICLILNFASFIGMTKAYEFLDKTPPRTSLMGFIPISSMLFFMAIVTGCQIFGYHWIQTYDWFVPFKYNKQDNLNYLSYENYVVFTISTFQYITMVVAFSKGKPYRQPLYTNTYLTISLIATTIMCVYIALDPAYWIKDFLEIKLPPTEGRYAVLIISTVCFIMCLLAEDVVVEYVLAKLIAPKFKRTKKKYVELLKEVDRDPEWYYGVAEGAMITSISEKRGITNNGFFSSQNMVQG